MPKIIRITTTWDDGSVFSCDEQDVTTFLSASGNFSLQAYLGAAFCPNLRGGLHWSQEPNTPQKHNPCS